MIKPTPQLLAALQAHPQLAAHLSRALAAPKPDLTEPLIAAAHLVDEVQLERPLLAGSCRAICAELGRRYPGAAIEVRVPPFAAVQVGFGSGPRHTRGTPPNVVEMTPDTLLRLASGKQSFDDARVSTSGVHARDVAQAFPLTSPAGDGPVPTA